LKHAAAAIALAAAMFCGCTETPTSAPSTPVPITRTRTITLARRAPSPTSNFTPAPAATVAPLPAGAHPAPGEVEKPCPYIASTPEDNPNRNLADIEGNHVYRTTILTRLNPVGCRFYFWAPPFEAITDIVPRRFKSATAAYNAMVLTGKAGRDAMGRKNFVPGVDGVLYRTEFFGPDRGRDWACVFAAGRTMVIVHTQRNDPAALVALLVARAVARKF
jgi:hypothetical protein